MLDSGVSLLKSLEVGSYVTGNIVLQKELQEHSCNEQKSEFTKKNTCGKMVK